MCRPSIGPLTLSLDRSCGVTFDDAAILDARRGRAYRGAGSAGNLTLLHRLRSRPAHPRFESHPSPTSAPTVGRWMGKVAFSVCADTCDLDEKKSIWVMNADGTGLRKLVDRASEPSFSPDGKQVAYYHYSDGVYVLNTDGRIRRGGAVGGQEGGGGYGDGFSSIGRTMAVDCVQFPAGPGGQREH